MYVVSAQDIEAGTIIGPWRCYVLTQDDYSRLQRRVPPDWQGPDSGRMRGQAWVELLHRSETTNAGLFVVLLSDEGSSRP